MLGLVSRSRLLEAELAAAALRTELAEARAHAQKLGFELEVEKRLRAVSEAEKDRLMGILVANPVEAGAPAPEPKDAGSTEEPPLRVLSGLEVVSRATRHRAVHNRAAGEK